jgi:hypothetical protein
MSLSAMVCALGVPGVVGVVGDAGADMKYHDQRMLDRIFTSYLYSYFHTF